jgi:hypothetical protein
MVVLSFFDVIGSCAYAFTSLPMPVDDYILGSKGNGATCAAQGFFIQLGTTSCYTNVSLAVYYLLVIKKGWSENKVKKARIWLFLCPILLGLALAFAGEFSFVQTICTASLCYERCSAFAFWHCQSPL